MRKLALQFALSLMTCCLIGCHGGFYWPSGHAPQITSDNPVFIQVADYDLLWDQVVDSVDTHFRIKREQRVRLVAGQLSDGRLETYPRIGSTILEPWRSDSTSGYEKWESTLQTVRRFAIVKVMPEEGGFLIEVEVHKELEDVPHKAPASRGIADLRTNGRLSRDDDEILEDTPTLAWIPMGRDELLEQRLLQDIRARMLGLQKTVYTKGPIGFPTLGEPQ